MYLKLIYVLCRQELDMQLQHHREVLFRQKQNLQALRTKEKDLTAQMLGSKAALSSLHGHMGKLEQNLLKQQEIIYNQVETCCICCCI